MYRVTIHIVKLTKILKLRPLTLVCTVPQIRNLCQFSEWSICLSSSFFRGTLPGMDTKKLTGPALLLKSMGIDVAAIEQQAMGLVNGLVAMQTQLDRIEASQQEIMRLLRSHLDAPPELTAAIAQEITDRKFQHLPMCPCEWCVAARDGKCVEVKNAGRIDEGATGTRAS